MPRSNRGNSLSAIASDVQTVVLAADGGFDFAGPLFIFVAIALAAAMMSWIFSRRSKASKDAATGGVADSFAVVIAPAPPLAENIARLRELVGETSPEPKITRYTRPVVTADERGLTVSDKKLGAFLTIPAADIVSVEARPTSLRPQGTLVATSYPSVWVSVRRGDLAHSAAFTPIVGAYNKVTDAEASSIASTLSARLGAARV